MFHLSRTLARLPVYLGQPRGAALRCIRSRAGRRGAPTREEPPEPERPSRSQPRRVDNFKLPGGGRPPTQASLDRMLSKMMKEFGIAGEPGMERRDSGRRDIPAVEIDEDEDDLLAHPRGSPSKGPLMTGDVVGDGATSAASSDDDEPGELFMDPRRPSRPLPQGTRRPGAGADDKARGSPVKRPAAFAASTLDRDPAAAARLQPGDEAVGVPGSAPGASSLIDDDDVDFVDVVADPASGSPRGPRTQQQQQQQPAGSARLAPPVLPTVERAPPPQSRRTSSRQRGRVVDATSSVLGSAEDRRRIRQFEWSSSDEHPGAEDEAAAAQRAREEREAASKAAEAALQARVEAVLSAATSIVARQLNQQQQQQQPALQSASVELLPASLTEGGLSTGDSMQPQGEDSLPTLPPSPPEAATLRAPTDLRDLARAVGLTPADILDGVGSRSFIAAKRQAKQAWLAAQEEAAAAAKAAAAAGEEAEQTEYETDYGDSSDEARAPPRRLTLADLAPSLHDASPDDIPDSMLPAQYVVTARELELVDPANRPLGAAQHAEAIAVNRERSEMLQLRKAALLMHSLSASRTSSSGGALRFAGMGGRGSLAAAVMAPADGSALVAGGSGSELRLSHQQQQQQQQLLQGGSAVGVAGRGSGGGSAPPLSQREQQEAAVGWDPHLVRRSAYAGIAPPDSADEAEMRRELGFPVPGDERRLKNAATIPRLPAIPLKHGPRAPNPVGSGITGVSSYSGVGTLQARAKEERLLTRRGVREITAERRKQDDEERAAAEAAGPEALAEWMMTQGESRPEDLDVGMESSDDEGGGGTGSSSALAKAGGSSSALKTAAEREAERIAKQRVSLVPQGYRNWSEVASALAGRPKREAKAREALERERQATLRLSIKAPTPAGGKPPSRRMVRVAANCHRILCDVLSKRAVKDAALYPAGQAIDITEVTMTPDLRRAYVLWALPFPVTCRARATDPAGLALEQRREREEARALRETAAAAAAGGPGYADGGSGGTAARLMHAFASAAPAPRRQTVRERVKLSPRATAVAHYGDETQLGHLAPSVAAVVARTHAALREHSASLRLLVGREMRMQWAPLLEFHRDVRAELAGGRRGVTPESEAAEGRPQLLPLPVPAREGGEGHSRRLLPVPRGERRVARQGARDGRGGGGAAGAATVPAPPLWRLPTTA